MLNFHNTYCTLPEHFFSPARPDKSPKPCLIEINKDFAINELGIDSKDLDATELTQIFSGHLIPEGANPIALAYAGHQFGHFSHQLGDGRALLLGEIKSSKGKQYDIQLKGSGVTAFSRNGDGKSSLGPVIREYILSEAMHHLGIPTTRALAALTTGETVFREEALPGGIFVRVASSHVRIGTFEYFASRNDSEAVKTLADYTINRNYPEIKNSENIYVDFLHQVADAQSTLVAKWMSVGFIHGVMNTDNMAISGETLDYGPCAFMDNFAFNRVYSSIDRNGRYSYNNQIKIALWNLCRLAECLIPLIHEDQKEALSIVQKIIQNVEKLYNKKWLESMALKLGIKQAKKEDQSLIETFLNYLESEDLDFTLSFRNILEAANSFNQTPEFINFHTQWQKRLAEQSLDLEEVKSLMNSVNPLFIPRNHQVEQAIQKAIQGDYSKFLEMNEILKNPFEVQEKFSNYTKPPLENERILATFCGT